MTTQRQSLDRISALPQIITEKILTHMPIRDALRTSILSRKWRYSWTTMPKLAFNDNMFVSYFDKELDKYKFINAIFHVFLLHKGPILEFTLFVNTKSKNCSEIDQILLHLSRSNSIKKLIFLPWGFNEYMLPSSFFSFQGLEHLFLSFCTFELPSMTKGFSVLKSLRFSDVSLSNKMLSRFLTSCPLLEEFTWTRTFNNEIEVTECELVDLFKCLPSVQVLKTSKLYIKHLAAGDMPHKLPISLPNLRILVLDVCFVELSFVLCVMSSSPNLEKITMKMCWDHDRRCPDNNLPDIQDYLGLNLDHLKELEITRFHNYALEMDFVKLIMAKSPMLKKARIELNSKVSVDEENKMLLDLVHMPFPRASPAATYTIERPKD